MKTLLKKIIFVCPIIATILVCVLITMYFINVNEYTLSNPMNPMNDTIFFFAFGQVMLAMVIAVILALIKSTRENALWIIIPLILFIFAFLYRFIVDIIYPCC